VARGRIARAERRVRDPGALHESGIAGDEWRESADQAADRAGAGLMVRADPSGRAELDLTSFLHHFPGRGPKTKCDLVLRSVRTSLIAPLGTSSTNIRTAPLSAGEHDIRVRNSAPRPAFGTTFTASSIKEPLRRGTRNAILSPKTDRQDGPRIPSGSLRLCDATFNGGHHCGLRDHLVINRGASQELANSTRLH